MFLKLRYFERRLSKAFKKLTLRFLPNSVLFNGQSHQKQKGPGTNSLSLFKLRNKFTKVSLLVTYYLTKFDGLMQSGFWVIPNITPWNSCKPFHEIIMYSFFVCPFESEKWKGRGKITKIWISRERKELFQWNKKHLSQFLKGYYSVRI